MSDITQFTLRIPTELKNTLQQVADEKGDTTMTALTIEAISSYIDEYRLNKVKNDDIPSASHLKKQIEISKEAMLQMLRNRIKGDLQIMVENACPAISTKALSDSQVPYELKEEFSRKLEKELTELGYYVLIYTCYPKDESPFSFMPFEILISIEESEIEINRKIEKENGVEVPF